ncbi:MAG: hypothetical protein A3C35_06260 [Omnitrophica bacterium RIFCSPHIGHO2_02_FULL_46_11]|nr:MAG: hypothetical protein A3A81_02580 [Omnitrophica bacterium RIFCSPLOWO2_01_FULL_45_10b]OGW87849.1 MAG: hypothetical protein A3C35_06260 [Omnitrophica bacterium RIFCSPHIGHO2_02_FULL_46_11]
MPNTFRFEILTPEKVFYSSTITSLVAPGMEGYFGVLAHHAPLVARSNGGQLKVREEASGQERFFLVGPGIFEVLKNRSVFLTKQAETASGEKAE